MYYVLVHLQNIQRSVRSITLQFKYSSDARKSEATPNAAVLGFLSRACILEGVSGINESGPTFFSKTFDLGVPGSASEIYNALAALLLERINL